MNRLKELLLLVCLIPALCSAAEWDKDLYQQIEQSIRMPRLVDAEVNITKTGASQHATPAANQKAIQKAIDRCSKRGGGRVVVPAGMTFATGALQLKSGVNLVVEEGATLQFVFQPEL